MLLIQIHILYEKQCKGRVYPDATGPRLKLFGAALSNDFKSQVNPFTRVSEVDSSILEFGYVPLLQIGMIVLNQDQNGKQCRFRWDGSVWGISSGSTLFATEYVCYRVCLLQSMFWSKGSKGLSRSLKYSRSAKRNIWTETVDDFATHKTYNQTCPKGHLY